MIGLKTRRANIFIQSKVKPDPIVTHSNSHSFSRALRQPRVITSSFDWFTGLPVSFLISSRDNFCFGCTKLN